MIKRCCDQAALALLRAAPARLMHHLMFILRQHPEIPDRWGHHIRPIHYYEPLPDFRRITAEQVERRRSYPAIDFNWSAQLELIEKLGSSYRDELAALRQNRQFDFANSYFAGFDAAVYYALIRHLRPARVIEIGAGYSSRLAHEALARNRQDNAPGKLICIEPYAESRLTEAQLDMELIAQPVEKIPLEFFSDLAANDILFIDSSHTVKFNGDVCYEFLEILPCLNPGVWVHVHDIFFPHDYPAQWLVEQRLAFNEQYLVEAVLSFNPAFAVALANHWLGLDHANCVNQLWPYAGNRRDSVAAGFSSLWLYRRATNDVRHSGTPVTA